MKQDRSTEPTAMNKASDRMYRLCPWFVGPTCLILLTHAVAGPYIAAYLNKTYGWNVQLSIPSSVMLLLVSFVSILCGKLAAPYIDKILNAVSGFFDRRG